MPRSWETFEELIFLKNLGTYREGHRITKMRLKLLENYVAAARERVDWGKVNGAKVIQFAEEQLAEERLKAG